MNQAVTLRIRRAAGWQDFTVSVPVGAYILDALEAAEKIDPGLLFRHSCHHASCGSCGLRANGREVLACLTPVEPWAGKVLRLEPLRNFPVVADLLVDFGPFIAKLRRVDLPLARAGEGGGTRFENCIECGLCVSACPVAGSDPHYSGPAALAAAGRLLAEPRRQDILPIRELVEGEHGAWRCHAAFECSQVCPAGVDPAGEIMRLRRGAAK